ncbi:MAG: hypothetical protein OHK0029_25150 [Armatimonadaceae bacterium]
MHVVQDVSAVAGAKNGTIMADAANVTQVEARPRLAFIEGIRAIAALIVVWNHIFAEVFPLYAVTVPSSLFLHGYSMVLGHLSVTTFIVLSGFCLMLPVVRDGEIKPLDIRRFFIRRAQRILPPYYFALLLSLGLVWFLQGRPLGIHFDSAVGVRPSDIIAHFLLLQNVFGTGKINYVFWSIATEWHLYFTFPFLLQAFRRFNPVNSTLSVVVLGIILQIFVQDSRLGRANVHYVGFFAAGMLASLISSRYANFPFPNNQRRLLAGISMACILIVSLCFANWGWYQSHRMFVFYDIFVGIFTFCLLILCSVEESNPFRRFLSWHPLAFIGNYSYSLYLMHVPVIAVFLGFVVRPLGLSNINEYYLMLILGTIVVLVCSYAFFFVFERPFLKSRQSANKSR